jgi:hypothetical protein
MSSNITSFHDLITRLATTPIDQRLLELNVINHKCKTLTGKELVLCMQLFKGLHQAHVALSFLPTPHDLTWDDVLKILKCVKVMEQDQVIMELFPLNLKTINPRLYTINVISNILKVIMIRGQGMSNIIQHIATFIEFQSKIEKSRILDIIKYDVIGSEEDYDTIEMIPVTLPCRHTIHKQRNSPNKCPIC